MGSVYTPRGPYRDVTIQPPVAFITFPSAGESSTDFSVQPSPGMSNVEAVQLMEFKCPHTFSPWTTKRNSFQFTDSTGGPYTIFIPPGAPKLGPSLATYLSGLINTANGGGDVWTITWNNDAQVFNWINASLTGSLLFDPAVVPTSAAYPLGFSLDPSNTYPMVAGGINSSTPDLNGPQRIYIIIDEVPPTTFTAPILKFTDRAVAPNIPPALNDYVTAVSAVFSVPVTVNYGYTITYSAESQDLQRFYIADWSGGITNLHVILTDEYGNTLNNNNAQCSMKLRFFGSPNPFYEEEQRGNNPVPGVTGPPIYTGTDPLGTDLVMSDILNPF